MRLCGVRVSFGFFLLIAFLITPVKVIAQSEGIKQPFYSLNVLDVDSEMLSVSEDIRARKDFVLRVEKPGHLLIRSNDNYKIELKDSSGEMVSTVDVLGEEKLIERVEDGIYTLSFIKKSTELANLDFALRVATLSVEDFDFKDYSILKAKI